MMPPVPALLVGFCFRRFYGNVSDFSAFNQVGSSLSPYILDILNQYGLPAPEVNRAVPSGHQGIEISPKT
jgi:hypothetical protein